jgi:hypothetical protein
MSSTSSYDEMVKLFAKDSDLAPFPVPEIKKRQSKATGFVINGKPEDVIYLIDGPLWAIGGERFLTVQYSTAPALAKVDAILPKQEYLPSYRIRIVRLDSCNQRVSQLFRPYYSAQD